MKKLIQIKILFISLTLTSIAFANIEKNLPIGLTEQESSIYSDYLLQPQRDSITKSPVAPVHALGEWEEADAAMTLWNNTSLLKALSENGNVKIIADNKSDMQSWDGIIKSKGLVSSKFSYYTIPTNSMWVRDYGPWWIVDGEGKFGIVDTVYNRPRPLDDLVPDYIGKELNVPVYKPGLVHTGGNYYSDSLGNAFSSTLVFKENSKLGMAEVTKRMLDFLGIKKYTTSPLGENVTIEHLDTFGKLVSPDTWVFSQFSPDSEFYKDSEKMVSILQSMKSPYGTPYKIHRLKMVNFSGQFIDDSEYRAYINSFVSNGALYFPAYGDKVDDEVKATYQAALPGYKIIGVDAQGTEWGDSVHCRTRNLIKKDTIFIFPQVDVTPSRDLNIQSEIIPTPGFKLQKAEVVVLKNGVETERIALTETAPNKYSALKKNLTKGSKAEFYIEATDSSGKLKRHPMLAPAMNINFIVD